MNDCQNIDKLDKDTLDLIAWAFENFVVGWGMCHAVEIRLDSPFKNLTEGGDGLVTHGGSDSRCYIKHYGNPDWAIIHWQDPTWKRLPHSQMVADAIANNALDRSAGE